MESKFETLDAEEEEILQSFLNGELDEVENSEERKKQLLEAEINYMKMKRVEAPINYMKIKREKALRNIPGYDLTSCRVWSPTEEILDKDNFVKSVTECYLNDDREGVMEMIGIYIQTLRKIKK